MKSTLFNTVSELEPRILLLLGSAKAPLGIDQITVFDLVSTFNKNYEIGATNLHGKNDSSSREISARRSLVKQALAGLIGKGYVELVFDASGFFYVINDLGKNTISRFSDEYSREYRSACKKTLCKLGNVSERDVVKAFSDLVRKEGNNG